MPVIRSRCVRLWWDRTRDTEGEFDPGVHWLSRWPAWSSHSRGGRRPGDSPRQAHSRFGQSHRRPRDGVHDAPEERGCVRPLGDVWSHAAILGRWPHGREASHLQIVSRGHRLVPAMLVLLLVTWLWTVEDVRSATELPLVRVVLVPVPRNRGAVPPGIGESHPRKGLRRDDGLDPIQLGRAHRETMRGIERASGSGQRNRQEKAACCASHRIPLRSSSGALRRVDRFAV